MLANINAGASKQEVIQKLGEPESASMENGFDHLYFNLHDHAFDHDENHYTFTFKDKKLFEFKHIPEGACAA